MPHKSGLMEERYSSRLDCSISTTWHISQIKSVGIMIGVRVRFKERERESEG